MSRVIQLLNESHLEKLHFIFKEKSLKANINDSHETTDFTLEALIEAQQIGNWNGGHHNW